ncbi:MAG: PD40 domain-containing protein, partial [Candidatus Zixiibacteriota bacterium]
MYKVVCVIVAATVCWTVCTYGQSEAGFPNLSGPYLGQEPPGKEFQPFAPGMGFGDILNAPTFSPDGDEAYWATRNGIVVSKMAEGRWTEPAFVSFSGTGNRPFYDDAPVISPDNKRLYFTSRRPISYQTPNQYHIWYVERTSLGWSEPRPLPEIINSTPGLEHWQLSISDSGTLYFSVFKENGHVIHFSNLADGEYTVPKQLDAVSSFGMTKCPFIA